MDGYSNGFGVFNHAFEKSFSNFLHRFQRNKYHFIEKSGESVLRFGFICIGPTDRRLEATS